MLSTVLSLAIVSLHAGEVCTIPNGVALVQPGRINWVLREPTFTVSSGTRAIVTRIAPEGMADVAEVKVYDGTDRLGWIEASGLTTVRSTMVLSAPAPRSERVAAAPPPVKSYGVRVDPNRGRRNGRLPDFSAVDMAFAGMASQVGAANFSRSNGNSAGSGLYVGPRQPPGFYAGGVGSSHRGGTYVNPYTNNHYQKRR